MTENEKNCDNCKHFHWYYDYCDYWNNRVNYRAVNKCFEPNEKATELENKNELRKERDVNG